MSMVHLMIKVGDLVDLAGWHIRASSIVNGIVNSQYHESYVKRLPHRYRVGDRVLLPNGIIMRIATIFTRGDSFEYEVYGAPHSAILEERILCLWC